MDASTNTVFVDFGDVLRYYRKKKGISQELLADGVCSREYIGLIEKGKNIPTLYMVDAFSKKMGINLFDAYALIIEHNDFDTHLKIQRMDDAISAQNIPLLYQLAVEYSTLPGFSAGVPYQCVMHAFALYYSNMLHDYDKAVDSASKGLDVSGLSASDRHPFSMLTNLDMCLLLVRSVALCRAERYDEGRSDLEFLRECAKLRFTESHYIANRNRRFDINIFALTTFNLCEFFPDEPERNLVLLDDSIKMLDRYECSCEQSDLLLYKARFLYDLGEMNGAGNCFNAGYYLIVCRNSRKEADERAMEILEERFESLKKTT